MDTGEERQQRHMSVAVSDPVTHCGFRWTEPLDRSARGIAVVSCMSPHLRFAGQVGFEEEYRKGFRETTRNGIVEPFLNRWARGCSRGIGSWV